MITLHLHQHKNIKKMETDKVKKLGMRIYSNGKKIEEAEKSGMQTRVPALVEKIIEAKKELEEILDSYASDNMENV